MAYENKGSMATTVTVSRLPDYSGNYNCNGVADETEINLALAEATRRGDGEVVLLEGDYTLAATVNVPANALLRGMGWGTVLNYDAGGNCITITGDNAKVRDLKIVITAGAGAGGTRPNCIFADTRTNLEIFGVWLVGDETVGDDGSNARQCGIVFSMVTFSRVSLCRSEDNRRNGIFLEVDSDNNIITGNTCNGNTAHGIYPSASDGNTITGNSCIGNIQHGMILSNSDNNTITGNSCIGNGQHGMQIFAGSNDNTFTGNMCNGNTRHGIWLHSCSDNTVVGNTCTGNDSGDTGTYDGINIDSNSDDHLVMSNTCDDNDRYGIGISNANCDRNWVKNNKLRGNTAGAFNDGGTDTKTLWIFIEVSDPTTNLGNHPVVTLPDDTDTYVYSQIPVPLEYQELVTAEVIVVQSTGANPNMVWTCDTDWGKLCSGEDYLEDSDTTGATSAMAQDDLVCLDFSAALTGIAAGDLIGVSFMRDGNNGADTINGPAYYLGIRIRYV